MYVQTYGVWACSANADMPCVMYLNESFGGHVELALLAHQLCLQLGGLAGELQLLLRPLPLQTA